MDFIFIIVGLVLLCVGGEGLVKGAVAIAERIGVSTLLVSLVIVGFGTSAPELLVCIKAALSGTPEIAVGNTVGSNIANVLLILGIGALLRPLSCANTVIRRDSLAVIGASVLVAGLAFTKVIYWPAGLVLLAALFCYLGWSYFTEKRKAPAEHKEEEQVHEHMVDVVDTPPTPLLKAVIYTAVGLGAVMYGADLLVNGASSIARSYGVPDIVIGLTLVAFGTSLPELATAIVASIKGHSDVIIGNVLGSNLFNILGILGATALIAPLPMGGRVLSIDIWLMLGSAVILYPAIISGRRISRFEGGFFLLLYVGYVVSMFIT